MNVGWCVVKLWSGSSCLLTRSLHLGSIWYPLRYGKKNYNPQDFIRICSKPQNGVVKLMGSPIHISQPPGYRTQPLGAVQPESKTVQPHNTLSQTINPIQPSNNSVQSQTKPVQHSNYLIHFTQPPETSQPPGTNFDKRLFSLFQPNLRSSSNPPAAPSGSPPATPETPKPPSAPSETIQPAAATFAQKLVGLFPAPLCSYLQLMRLHQPIGSWLLFWPCGWSLALAAGSGGFPDPMLLSLFASGAIIMRGAGCTINDMWDRNIDGKVMRTATRPLADGSLTLLDATSLLAAQLGLACFILLQLNFNSIILGASSLGLVVVYPLMKRVTWFPQLVLGLTFNWGALLGWTAVTNTLNAAPFFLYTAGVAWTLIYDTIYAHQDKKDDVQIGIKSTALKFGTKTQPILGFISTGMLSSLLALGIHMDLAWPYYMALLGISTHIARQIWTLKINDPSDCGQKFRSNRHVGLMIFLGIVGGTVLKEEYLPQ